MKYPDFLNKNNKIYLVAPSFGCTTEPYMSRLGKAIDNFKAQGLEVIEGPNIYSSVGHRSNTAPMCVLELMMGYQSGASLLMSVGGGELMNELLDFINFDELATLPPVWFMGYSDNTNLTFTLNTLLDTASIYAGCAPEFGTDDLHESQLDALRLIKGEKLKFKGYDKFELNPLKNESNPYLGYNLTEEKKLICYPESIHMEGRLLGGCIDSLRYLIGTPYDKVDEFIDRYHDDGIIWFLEACDLDVCGLRLTILQMKRHGWFRNAKGFMFGRSLKIDDTFFSIDMHSAIYEVLRDLNVPIILDADFGHLKPQIPVISGSYAIINAKDNIEIEYILK